jgi:hypothetical protein
MKISGRLTTDEMECVKTALSVIVLKRRLEIKLGASKKQKAPSSIVESLKNVTGETLFRDTEDDAATTMNIRQLPLLMSFEDASADDTDETAPWMAHLQHIIQLSIQKFSSNDNHHQHQQQQYRGLAVHVACQIQQLLEASKTNRQPVETFLKQQIAKAKSTNDHTLMASLEIWKIIIETKPTLLPELITPILIQQLTSASSTTTTTNQDQDTAIIFAILLLEHAYAVAAPTIRDRMVWHLQNGDGIASWTTTTTTHGGGTGWLHTTDLATEYSTLKTPEPLWIVHAIEDLVERITTMGSGSGSKTIE